MNNLFALNAVDLYKPSHADLYHEKTEVIFSNFTPRGDKYFTHKSGLTKDGVIVAGVQRLVNYVFVELWEEFFSLPRDTAVGKYEKIINSTMGVGVISGDRIGELWDLAYLPMEFRSQTEGILSPIGVPVFTIHNTHRDFFWLTNYLETVLSAESWKVMTGATTAFQFRVLAEYYANKTCDNNAHVPFQMHDFSLRGLSCMEDGYKNGIAHLFSFKGTDSLPAVQCIEDHYSPEEGEFIAGSIVATEHSVVTTNINYTINKNKGNFDGQSHGASLDNQRFYAEVGWIKKYITQLHPTGVVAHVSDSYDFWRIVSQGLPLLKEEILSREGTLIIRPDSGIPEDVVCGIQYVDGTEGLSELMYDLSSEEDNSYPNVVKTKNGFFEFDLSFEYQYGEWEYTGYKLGKEIPEVEVKGLIETLWEIFGGTTNSKGYKVLDIHIGAIYGDSISMKRAKTIFERLEKKGFASSNINLGIGSYTYQMVSRDTFGFAMKSTGTIIDGKSITVSKDPKTDPSKKSAKGFLKVVRGENSDFELVESEDLSIVNDSDNTLLVRFLNGELYNKTNLTKVRCNVNSEVEKALDIDKVGG